MEKRRTAAENIITKHPELDLKIGEMNDYKNRFEKQSRTEGTGSALFELITSVYNLGLSRGYGKRNKL